MKMGMFYKGYILDWMKTGSKRVGQVLLLNLTSQMLVRKALNQGGIYVRLNYAT